MELLCCNLRQADTEEAYADNPLAYEEWLELYEQGRIKGARGPREDTAKALKWYRKSPRLVSGGDNLTPVVAINKFEFVRMSGTSKLLYIHFYALNMFFCVCFFI